MSAGLSYGPVAGHRSTNGGGERVFAHISDLVMKAGDGYNRNSSIRQLLEVADLGLNQANTLNDVRRPDLAFVEYLRASEILLNVIPHHKEYVHITYDQPERAAKLGILTKKANSMSEQYGNIRQIIKDNNTRHDTAPILRKGSKGSVVNTLSRSGSSNSIKKVAPPLSPKPDALHGKALATTDSLTSRFAQLRHDQPVVPPRPSSKDSSPTSTRPLGPRDMPDNSHAGPRLNTNIPLAMPQEPKATYSPARNMQTTGNIALPRHSARSLAGPTPRRQSSEPSSNASNRAPNGYAQSGEYFPLNGTNGIVPNRKRSIHIPQETRISPEKFYDYLKKFRILLIDFRPREQFDQGHIYASNVMCIEPSSVRKGMSAEELYEGMVLSPDSEADMFYNRDAYDFVVYYDESTRSQNYLEHPTTQHEERLKSLHEALSDFNQEKPLPRPPVLLIGGLEVWVNVVGNQALQSSNTVSEGKGGRPPRLGQTPATNGDSPFRFTKTRGQKYNPLDEEEEIKWRERARAESVALPKPDEINGRPEDHSTASSLAGSTDDNDPGSAIKDFLLRFPEAGSLTDRQIFAGTMPNRPAPERPAKIPIYPPPPPPSDYPSVPTRPAPAAPRMSNMGVSDRAVASTTPLTRSVSGAPYIPQKFLATNLRLPRTGLINFGNTCYMNSTIQALSAATPLSVFFLNDEFKSQLQRNNWRSNSKGVMAELYSNLIRSLWKGDVDTIRPTTFRRFCGRAYQSFESDGVQQDAKEFLDFLLDCLHEDLNVTWQKPPLRAFTEEEEARNERMPKLIMSRIEWDRYVYRDLSYVQSLFGGQHLSKLSCRTCGFTSSKYEFFSSVSVEIPSDPKKYANGRHPSLEDCLRSYCTEETLNAEEAWNCPRCKKPRETTKRITITRVPQILIVHFKRFDNTGRTTRKVRTPVDFPLDGLDLAPFVLPPPTAAEARAITDGYGPEYLKTDESMTPPYTYDAFGVIRHIGPTLQSGHYVTAVKDRARKKWLFFNDSKVHEFRPEELKSSQLLQNDEAYIVWYSRTNTQAPPMKI